MEFLKFIGAWILYTFVLTAVIAFVFLIISFIVWDERVVQVFMNNSLTILRVCFVVTPIIALLSGDNRC